MKTSIPLFFFILIFATGCKPNAKKENDFSVFLMGKNEGIFRGFSLGILMDSIRTQETGKARIDDECGLVYDLIGEKGETVTLEYFNVCPPMNEARKLAGIIVSVKVKEEMEASDLLVSLEEKIRRKFGVGEGGFGDWEWSRSDLQTGARLRLSEDRKEILINFFKL